MPTRPFYVQRNGDCIPLEGGWRVAEIEGDWYVLGHHSAVRCDSERAARSMFEELSAQSDVDALANEAIEGLDRIPETWETETLGEAEL